jgi:CubicO group peptidase (beta-lactamase class C family)
MPAADHHHTIVQGTCDPRFALVREEFERNFRERDEVGASVCVRVAGDTVVDLWGGLAHPETGAPWQQDTVGLIFSSTKGATALCAHILASRGLLDLDAPVARYWPEFSRAGKDAITVKMLLNHTAGLPGIREPLPPGAYYDWDLMTGRLAAEAPFWEPGTRHGYHAMTFGWLVGEVVRRISGRSLGAFFRDEVAGPLGLDFWIGLPEAIEPRVAPIISGEPPARDAPPRSLPPLFLPALLNNGGYQPDSRAAHAAEIPAVGGVTNAHGLAGIYAPLACGGALGGVHLVDRDTLARMGAVSSAGEEDAVLLLPLRFTLGFWKAIDHRRLSAERQASMIVSEEAFGHPGAGGSVGFADPRAGLAFGYTMNRMGSSGGLNARGQSLVDATYRALGYTSNASGTWI